MAINKIDREGSDVERTKAGLAEHGLMPEEWGGEIMMIPVSAKTGEGVEKLVEAILLIADVEELKADVEVPAEGLVIESHMETGKGSVVNLLVTGGELKVGEFVAAGGVYGKIRTMTDFRGKPKGKAGPSTPVTVTGFKELPNFGDRFLEYPDEKSARRAAVLAAQAQANEAASANVTSTDLLRMMNVEDNSKVFNVIIKGDVLGSVTSVVDSLKLIDTKGEVTLNVVATGVGDVTENDIYMAAGENTVVYGFNVNVPTNIAKLAARDGVEVRNFRVIYELLDDAKASMEKLLGEEVVETVVGEMKVMGVFRVTKTELIAGGEMTSGKLVPGVNVRVLRKKEILGEAVVESVQKERIEAKELIEKAIGGLAMKTEKKIQLEVGDKLEFFTREMRQRKLGE